MALKRPSLGNMSSVDLEDEECTDVQLALADCLWTTARDGAVRLRMEETGIAAEPPITTLQLFQRTVQLCGNKPALATKRGGQWETTTYLQYYQQCRAAAKSFLLLGLEPFHGVGILGFNSAEWFIADIGAIMAGGLAVGIYATSSPEACQYVAANCEANVLVVENHQQLVKILEIEDQLPHLKAIVQYHDELNEERAGLYTWKDFMELGTGVPDSKLDNIIASRKANQCCTLIYTSGTTGRPKGVMLSHDNITWVTKAFGESLNLTDNEVTVSYLPLSHVAAQILDIWIPICFGGTTYFANPDALKGTLVSTLQEVRPTTFFGVPRVWEKIQEKMKDMGSKSSFIKQKISSWAKKIGLGANYNRMNGCGRCLVGCMIRIHQPQEDGAGEICYWGRHVFMGYLNMPEMTMEALDEEGWLHSGDLGKLDQDGFLYVTGRIKELVITAGGENVPPVPIEDALKEELPIISNAMLVGDQRKFLSMLLTLKCTVDVDTGEPQDDLTAEAIQFCQQLGSSATRVSEVIGTKDPAIYEVIQEAMDRVNQKALSNAQKVQKWAILGKDFSIAGGELGPTLKLKRPVVLSMYEKVIDGFYVS
ncbi:long-chain-fatty-acid--CoA ligase ACSBG2-like isoform X2 [Ambystoma mexicanum]|uniref:long-chain-fatty-acid--CoA ligase ACSBG2-like isoform X2 n=1 Tax=Ambystoma mexicanum TaxID=8296 RepID=UPI0037E78DC6